MSRRAVSVFVLLLLTVTLSHASLVERDLVVYQRDLAEIREVHTIDLAQGDQVVAIPNILPGIEAGSVSLEILSGRGVETTGLSYSNRLFSFDNYWNALLNSELEVAAGDSSVSGILRRVTSNTLFLENGEGALIPLPRSRAEENRTIDALPSGVVTSPSLLWGVTAKRAGEVKVKISYLTTGLTWEGEHKVLLNGRKGSVVAGALLRNETGNEISFNELSFVAGDVHLAGDQRKVDRLNPEPGASTSDASSRFGQLRRWNLDEGGKLYPGASAQFTLADDDAEGLEINYVYDASIYDDRVRAKLGFALEMALPAGEVRIYEERNGSPWLIGSDKIDGTPPGSPLKLTMAQSFDLTAERKRTVERAASGEDTWQNFVVLIGNSGDADVTVRVIERTFGEWTVPNAELDGKSIEMIKLDARTAAFDVPVPSGKTVKLCYEIRYER